MASVTSATTPAATPAVNPNAVNEPVGSPAAEHYPGAVDPQQYQPGSGPVTPGSVQGPPYGTWGDEPFAASLPPAAGGGGFQDTAWTSGNDAPMLPWDSAAGAQFAPSGAVNPDLHGVDTGGVWRFTHVTPAEIGTLTRRTGMGQTTVRNGSGDQVTKD